jgi:hypothetical protein
MNSTIFRVITYVVATTVIAGAAIRAFSMPWHGTADQWLVVFVSLCLIGLLITWGYIWARHGRAGLKERWKLRRERFANAAPISTRFLAWGLVFWIAVAVALVIFFNMTSH